MLSIRNKARFMSVITILAMLFSFANVSPVAAQDPTPPAMPGIVQGTGTFFEVTNSDYLNVTVTSTAEINLYLNSAPKIINMRIDAASTATSTDITLGGLEANTTYWKYQDASVDGVQFTTDAAGRSTFTLDLSQPRGIRIQPGESTYYIYDDGPSGTGGNCTAIGTWDGASKTCTLNQDVNDAIYIYDSSNTNVGVTLDGAGYQVNLPTWGSVQVAGNNHTVKNLKINGTVEIPYSGYYCSSYGGYYCEPQPTGYGVYLYDSTNANVTNVTVSNTYYALFTISTRNSTIQDNTFSGAAIGAYVYGNYYQYYCDLGYLYYCGSSGNTLSNNTFSPYSSFYRDIGVYLVYAARNNTIRGNTISNFNYGLYVYDYYCYYGDQYCPNGNTIYQNNFIDSIYSQIYAYGYSTTVYNKAAPDGGNYFSDFHTPAQGCDDANSDGFCDTAHAFYSGQDNLPWTTQDGWATPADTTAPVITYTLTPPSPDGANGWYKSNVTLAWSVTDPESAVTMTDCVDQNIIADQAATTYSCSATSAGGSSGPVDVSIKRDAQVPTVSLVGGPADGGSYYFGSVPAAPACSASDALSGLDGSCVVSNYSALVGPHTVSAAANDIAGNQNTASAAYTVLAWTTNGFFQPVDMGGVWNTVRNGSTVPLKFEVFAGSTELTSTSIVNQPLTATQTLCSGGPTDDIELTATGATSLRYDTTSGQFIYNWQTPRKPGYCYVVTVKLADGTSISANFKLK